MSSLDPGSAPNLQRLMGRINYERQVFPPAGELKLDRLRELMGLLGNPELARPVIHIAGTKGKGTTTRLIAEIAQSHGLTTGTYTSPHLTHFRERICLDGVPVSDQTIETELEKLWPWVDEMDRRTDARESRSLTFFDLATTLAFRIFAARKPDLVVLETGLGGRLDSTNVCLPLVSVITNISLDHCRQLGNTHELIAAEKAGIIKPGVPVISGVDHGSPAGEVIAAVALRQGAPLWQLGRDVHLQDVQLGQTSTRFSLAGRTPEGESFEMTDLQTCLLGRHSAHNAALAIMAARFLPGPQTQPVHRPDPASVRSALREVRITGRIEMVSRNPTVILDVAHNPAAAAALAETLRHQLLDWRQARSRTLVIAISRDKDQAGILAQLVPLADRILTTRFCENPRATDPVQLAEMARSVAVPATGQEGFDSGQTRVIEAIADPQEAWRIASENAGPQDAICVTGSFFLIAELRDRILRDYGQMSPPD